MFGVAKFVVPIGMVSEPFRVVFSFPLVGCGLLEFCELGRIWFGESVDVPVQVVGMDGLVSVLGLRFIGEVDGDVFDRTPDFDAWMSQRIHYDFVKPHAALEGQTPADRAGVGVEGRDKWLTILGNAIASEKGQAN